MCTGICLLLEHDLLELACATATLDVLSNGRLTLGVGVGWNEEELANHRPDLPFRRRYSAMRERVAALRAAWTEETPSFAGKWDRFEESWVYPKPQQGSIPVALGNAGPVGIEHAAAVRRRVVPHRRRDVEHGRASRRRRSHRPVPRKATANGRDPDTIPITIFAVGRLSLRRFTSYAQLGVSRLVFPPPTMEPHGQDETLRYLDSLDEFVAALG